MKTFFESMKKFRVLWIFSLLFFCLTLLANQAYLEGQQIVYSESLDTVLATVQGEEFTLRDFAVYVAHQEAAVQDQALAYDMNDTKKYWNVRTDLGFINQVARNEAMSMAIHDELFYQFAMELQLKLTEEELQILQNDVDDFWFDLTDDGKEEKLGITKEDIYAAMEKIAYAQKAQYICAFNCILFQNNLSIF